MTLDDVGLDSEIILRCILSFLLDEHYSMMDGADDALHDACGVFGCVSAAPWPNTALDVAVDVIYPALANLQHRYVHVIGEALDFYWVTFLKISSLSLIKSAGQ